MVHLLPVSASHYSGENKLNGLPLKFEVLRALDTWSPTVVYQVRQISTGYNFYATSVYNQEYALEFLPKVDLDEDPLSGQVSGVCGIDPTA